MEARRVECQVKAEWRLARDPTQGFTGARRTDPRHRPRAPWPAIAEGLKSPVKDDAGECRTERRRRHRGGRSGRQRCDRQRAIAREAAGGGWRRRALGGGLRGGGWPNGSPTQEDRGDTGRDGATQHGRRDHQHHPTPRAPKREAAFAPERVPPRARMDARLRFRGSSRATVRRHSAPISEEEAVRRSQRLLATRAVHPWMQNDPRDSFRGSGASPLREAGTLRPARRLRWDASAARTCAGSIPPCRCPPRRAAGP
jgi:hypothetical protein